MRSRAFALTFLVLVALLGGVTADSVAAATSTTVTWNVSSMTSGQVKELRSVATSNSPGVKTWSKTGSCTLSLSSSPKTIKMGSGNSCTLTLKIAKSGKYPAKTSSKTLARALFRVGQKGPGGGLIFYVDLTRSNGSRYFEVACAGWQNDCDGITADPKVKWGCWELINGADGIAIGTGQQNTADIVAGCGVGAKLADDYMNNGVSDWFLPSKDELNALCVWAWVPKNPVCNNNNQFVDGSAYRAFGGFSDGAYQSSTQLDKEKVWFQYFNYGFGNYGSKGYQIYVRPIRSF